jgi:acyl carrier protein
MTITAEEILSIMASEAKVEVAALKPEATLVDLDISSLDVVSVIFELEDRFGLEIEPESIAPTSTVAEFVDHVMSLSAK